jgi:hypothetical protein
VEIAELAALLQAHAIDTTSLALTLNRGDEYRYELAMPPHELLLYWRQLRDLAPVTGRRPVFGWGRRWLDAVPEYRVRVEGGSTAHTLAESERVDLARWRQNG